MKKFIKRFSLFVLLFIACSNNDEEASSTDCDISSQTENQTCISVDGNIRTIKTNALPNHEVGAFPNAKNPNSISAQNESYTMTTEPKIAASITGVLNENGFPPGSAYKFGVGLNGIAFDPAANEPWENKSTGDLDYAWNLEAIFNDLGMDLNNAHVQPTGAYHYHGLPVKLYESEDGTKHSELYGYAADGFPIYILYAYSDAMDANSSIKKLKSSYRLKEGARPGDGITAPNGNYDGTYTQDYEYVEGLGDLDECNGRTGVTPDYPNGTYYYVISEDFPFIPRFFKGSPDNSFKLGGGAPPKRFFK